MNFAQIDSCEIANGKFVGVSLYVQGCDFHCNGCFNQSTWDFSSGRPYDKDVNIYLLELCNKKYIRRLSILGGEPLHPNNITDVIKISKLFKDMFPCKQLWVWTGYTYETIINKEILNYADYIVDGQFNIKLKDPSLMFRGSSNQRIIDVKQTLKNNHITLLEE